MVNQGEETIDAFHHYPHTNIIPPKLSFREFMYNAEKKTVMGRTADSWSKCHSLFDYVSFLLVL